MAMTLFDIAVQYHVRCELFDRTVCSGWSERGSAMPVGNWEYRQVNLNAAFERAIACALGANELHASSAEIEAAIRSDAVHREAERMLKGVSIVRGDDATPLRRL